MSYLKSFVNESLKHTKRHVNLIMNPKKNAAFEQERQLIHFASKECLDKFSTGSDNRTTLELQHSSDTIQFKGTLSDSGYAIIRTKMPPLSIYGHKGFDLSKFKELEFNVQSTDEHQYYVNIRSDVYFSNALYQAKLNFKKSNDFQTVKIPFDAFLKTMKGFELENQSPLDPLNIQTIGISVIKTPGPFSLQLKKLSAINTV